MSHKFDLSQATMLEPVPAGPRRLPSVEDLAHKWKAVHDAAAAVGHLAQFGRETPGPEIIELPVRAADRGERIFEAAARGIDDLAAVMQPGLRALLALTAQGQDTTIAALVLWREFHAARTAIVDLVEAAR